MAYFDKFGVVFSDDRKTLVRCPKNFNGEYEIPNGVTSIGNGAFCECTALTSVTIPNCVTSIGESAFYECNALTSVTIPNSVTSIGDDAFYNCSGLPVIDNMRYADTYLVEVVDKSFSVYKIKDGTKWIGSSAFSWCTALISIDIPKSVTSIGKCAFRDCRALTSVMIGNSVISIGNLAFYGCSGLISFDVENDNPYYRSLNGVLFNKDKTKLIQYPGGKKGAYTIPNSVICIESYAFAHCKGLTSVAIPNSVTNIGGGAFENCSGLTSVTIPSSVTCIGDAAFCGCCGMTSVAIPNSVTSIGNNAFNGCSRLTSVEIPNSVTTIGSYAFYGCGGLTSVSIPNSVTNIGESAFNECCGLPVIDNLRYADTYLVEVVDKSFSAYKIKDGTKWIGNSAFVGCSDLTSVTIPNSVTSIGNKAFAHCGALISIEIPNSVTSIGNYAFHYCTALISMTIGNSVNNIEYGAFYGCSGLTSVIIPNNVTNIGYNAFYKCSNLTSVEIPNSVTSIGIEAFDHCESLQEIIVPKGQKARFSQMEGLKNLKDIIVERDDEELIVLFNLGKAYELGIGVTKSVAQAILFYVQSAEKGCADAAYHLGEWYRDGRNVPHDNEKALFYFQQAAKSAFSDAGKQVKILEAAIENKEKEKKLMTEEYEIINQEKTYYLFFDTETTGVPRNYKAPMQDTANWPRLVQLAWLLVGERGTELRRKSVIIRPDGFTIPEEAAQVHGITTERAQNEGLPLRNVLDEFMQDLELAEEIVGHNIDFDIHIVGAELCRLGLSTQKISNKPTTCTMKSFTNFCAIPSNNGYGGYKWPTLEEFYFKVFGREITNAHDALTDTLATKECFFELKNQFKAKSSSVLMSAQRTDLSDLPF